MTAIVAVDKLSSMAGDTASKPLVPETVNVAVGTIDALSAGQTLRALARDKKTPPGVRELLGRVGSQLASAARAVLP